ncbi:hypothetical protein ACVMB2_006264 [Sinorhizobium meliloti]
MPAVAEMLKASEAAVVSRVIPSSYDGGRDDP